jgi:tetratricopeptide (TPR) repeat protein
MSSKRSPKTVAGDRPKKGRSSRRRMTLSLPILAAGILAGGSFYLTRPGAAARVPEVSTQGFEPVIAAQIGKAVANARANPRQGPAWGRLGLVLQAYEFSPQARFCFEQAERFDPTQPRWPYFHGLLLSQIEPKAATARLQRAAELADSKQDAPRLRLARSLLESGNYDQAREQFQRLVQAQPSHAPAQLALAEIGMARGRAEDSRAALTPCLSNAFTARRAHTLLAQVERQLGHAAAAEDALRSAASLPADRAWPDIFAAEAASYHFGKRAWTEQAQQLVEQKRYDEAQVLVERLLKHYPEAPEGWLLQGRLRLEQNDCAEAARAFEQHLRRAPESVNGLAQLGIALLCLKRYAESVPVLQRAIQLKSDYGEAHFNLGFALAGAGRAAEAMPSFRNAIRFSPEMLDAYVMLADLLLQDGQAEEARRLLQKAQPLAPSDERIKMLMQRSG